MAAVLFLYVAARASILPGVAASDIRASVFARVDVWTRVLTAIGVLGRYLRLLVYPATLSADYSWYQIPLIDSAGDMLFLLSALACSALVASGVWLAIRRSITGLSIVTYFAALFPISNIAFSTGTQMAERLLYLPSVGFCLFLPAAFSESGLGGRRGARRLATAGAALLAVAYGARTLVRNGDWVDQYTLFSRTAATSPRSAKAHYGYGLAAAERGDSLLAVEEYRRAIEIKPDMPEPRRNLGLELLRVGTMQEAYDQLTIAATLDPNAADVDNDLGLALVGLGRTREAEEAFRTELRLRPEGKHADFNLGKLLLDGGRPVDALPYLERATALAPDDPEAQGRKVMALALTGRPEDAIAALDEAIRESPTFRISLDAYARAALEVGQTDLGRACERRAASLRPGGVLTETDPGR
jgi:Flp pilus assembly protein TadD